MNTNMDITKLPKPTVTQRFNTFKNTDNKPLPEAPKASREQFLNLMAWIEVDQEIVMYMKGWSEENLIFTGRKTECLTLNQLYHLFQENYPYECVVSERAFCLVLRHLLPETSFKKNPYRVSGYRIKGGFPGNIRQIQFFG